MKSEALAQNQSRSDILDLDIQGVSSFVPENRNVYTITGEVFNNNTFPFNSVQVSATLYDNNDQPTMELFNKGEVVWSNCEQDED